MVVICELCGRPQPRHSPEGLCPKCLIGSALTQQILTEPSPSASPSLRQVGRYEVLECIATGGMGIVYKARQVDLNRIVALKMLPFGQYTRDSFIKRFRAEAEAAAKLKHPNIVAIHEVGEHEGQPFFSMDYIEGATLADLARDQPLTIARAVRFVGTIAEAVHYAHGMGILHRDLKPSNILIDALDQPHVTDFGLARDLHGNQELTLTGQTLGSPNYMPPEQIDGRTRSDATIDVYSLGAVFYHLLTGRPPFLGETLTTTLQQVSSNEPVSPRLLNPAVPRDLETICLKCLEKEPARRYRTTQELAEELARWRADEPIRARSITKLERCWRWCKRKPGPASALVTGLVLVLTLAVGLTALWARTREARLARLLANKNAIHSRLDNAKTLRRSVQAGRVQEALSLLEGALSFQPDPDELGELRDEAIANLALLDARLTDLGEFSQEQLKFNASQNRVAVLRDAKTIEIRSLGADARPVLLQSAREVRSLLEFSSNDRFFSAWEDPGTIVIWDIERQRVVSEIAQAISCAFTPDGAAIYVSRNNGALLLAQLDGTDQKIIPGISRPFNRVAIPRSGRWIAGLSPEDKLIELRDLTSGQTLRTMTAPQGARCLAVSDDGAMVAVGTLSGQIATWNALSGEPRFINQPHTEPVELVSFSHDASFLASAGQDSVFQVMDARTGYVLVTIPCLAGQCDFRGDDLQIAFVREGKRSKMVELIPSKIVKTLQTRAERPGAYSVGFSHNGELLAAGERQGVRVWNVAARTERQFIPMPDPYSSVFARDDRSVIICGPNGLFQQVLTPGTRPQTPPKQLIPETRLGWMAMDREATRLLVADRPRSRALLLPIDAPDQRLVLGPHPDVDYVCFSPDGKLAATGTFQSRDVKVWSTIDGAPIVTLPAEHGARPQFSADGRWLTVGSDAPAYYDVTNWKLITVPALKGTTQITTPAEYSPANDYFVIATHLRDLQLFDQVTRARVAVLTPPPPSASGMPAFSPDGRLLASMPFTGDVQLWDLIALRRELAKRHLDR